MTVETAEAPIFRDSEVDLRHRAKWWTGRIVLYGALILWALICLFPIYWTVSTSFKVAKDVPRISEPKTPEAPDPHENPICSGRLRAQLRQSTRVRLRCAAVPWHAPRPLPQRLRNALVSRFDGHPSRRGSTAHPRNHYGDAREFAGDCVDMVECQR